LAWAAIAVGLASGAANPALLARNYHLYHTGFLLYGALSVTGQLLWIWLVARKRQNWARWISLFWILLSILGIESTIRDMERFLNPVAAILFYAAFAISIVSVMLLFRSDASGFHESVSRLALNPALPSAAVEFFYQIN